MVRHARERGGAASAALALGVLALIVAGLHDYAFQTGLLAITASFWLPYVMPLALGCLAVLLVGRMVRAVGEVEALNIELDRRVAARTRELEAANAAQTRFLAAASHDLRQPVVTIGLLVGLVREQVALPPVRAMVDRIYAAVGSMEALLNGLMDLSRLEPGTLKPRLQPVPLAWIFDAISLHEQTAAALKGLRLTFRPTALVVTSDPVLLDQIVRNLVSNAVRYTERGGVLVGARRRGAGTVIVQVWDSGVGIAADAQARVFDEFVQLANPGRDRSKGQGLGLAIVRRGAQALGHRLELRSVAGRGSCFTIELPLAAQALAPEVVAASPPDPLHARVLWLIEDDAALRDALSLRLTRWGAQVTALASVADVRRQLDTCAAAPALLPALILSDQRLPDGSGLECIALIRAAAGHPVPAVVVSGDTAPADLARLAAAGLPVLRKPFRAAELLALLHAALPEDSATLDRCRRGRRHQPQPEARGGDDSLGARIRIELAEDRREMGLDGRFGHIERARDQLVRLAFDQHSQHLALARGKAQVGRIARPGRRHRRGRRRRQQPRRQVDAARHHDPQRGQHARRFQRLRDIARRTRLDRGQDGFVRIIGRHHHQGRVGGRAQLRQQVQPVTVGQGQVEQHQLHVRMQGQQLPRLRQVAGLQQREKREFLGHQQRQRIAQECVVIDEQRFFHDGEKAR